MDKLEHETISFIKELVGYKSVGGNKWFDEIQKSFGSFYIFKTVCKSDSRLIHALSEMSGKSYSVVNKELREKAVVAEQILSTIEDRPEPNKSFQSFKATLFEAFYDELPVLYNKYESMVNEHPMPKHTVFKNNEKTCASDCTVVMNANASLLSACESEPTPKGYCNGD
jgi:hypothetical protein